MKGAREYTPYIETGQHGRLYIKTGSHARGQTLHIYILPEGVDALVKARSGVMVVRDEAVKVYGVLSGNPGWTETYGWIHTGKWCEDFQNIIEDSKKKKLATALENSKIKQDKDTENKDMELKLLNTY